MSPVDRLTMEVRERQKQRQGDRQYRKCNLHAAFKLNGSEFNVAARKSMPRMNSGDSTAPAKTTVGMEGRTRIAL